MFTRHGIGSVYNDFQTLYRIKNGLHRLLIFDSCVGRMKGEDYAVY